MKENTKSPSDEHFTKEACVKGKIIKISGPIVYAEGMARCGLYDVVDVGEKKLIGEIIRQSKGKATIQVYEEDTGMRIGEKVVCKRAYN